MASYTGFVDNSGGTYANRAMLAFIKTACETEGWTTLRYDTASGARELIMRAPGLSGTQEIFVGLRSYQNAAADYYNLSVAGFVGYVPANAFTAQPGYRESGIPAHNVRIDYWLTVNGQRLAFGLKVGTPVYESGYVGLFRPYGTPAQFPYPLVVGGMLDGPAAVRYSETSHSMPYKGERANFAVRFVDGSWKQVMAYPWKNGIVASGNYVPLNGGFWGDVRDTGGSYPASPVLLMSDTPSPGAIFGELDGIYHFSGFNNVVENTTTIDGEPAVIIQDVGRTGFRDYYALRMD